MIKVHSSVALITNSSTTIYSSATESTVEQIRSFIEAVLKLAGSDKSVDELCTITLVPSSESLEREAESLQYDFNGEELEYLKEEVNIAQYITDEELLDLCNGRMEWKQVQDLIARAIAKGYTLQFSSDDDYERRTTYDVEVRGLNGNLVDAQSLLNSIDTWETYC